MLRLFLFKDQVTGLFLCPQSKWETSLELLQEAIYQAITNIENYNNKHYIKDRGIFQDGAPVHYLTYYIHVFIL